MLHKISEHSLETKGEIFIMKKFLKILALTICILMTSACVFASDSATKLRDDIIVQLNGEIIDFTDANGDKVEAQIMNDRTMVPMRKIFEVLGAEVEWDGENRIVTGKKEDTEIKLQIGNNIATKKISEETKNIELDVTPTIVNGRTLVPVRFIAESLDKKVGWDAKNRAVIIIDSDEIENKIKNNASNLYELLTNKFENPKTYEADLVLNGTIKDSEQSKIKGNMNIKVNETAAEIHLNLNSDEKDFKDIDASMILDIKNYTVYVKSDSIKNSDGMWVKYEFDDEEKESMKRVFDELKTSQELDTKYIFNNLIDEKNFTLDFYKELNQIVEMVTKVAGNDNLKKSGNTKYEFSIDMEDLINAMSTQMSSIEILALKAKYAFNMTLDFEINNNIATKSNFSLAIGIKNGSSEQKLELDLRATLKNYNKSIEIQYPSGKNVITSKELESRNTGTVVSRALFSSFATEMGGLREAVQTAITTAKGDEAIRGKARSNAQLANFVARGGYEVLTKDENGEELWLTRGDADSLPCTQINKKFAADILGTKLPVRKVETYKGSEQEMSYFVTPKGQVFCWPPYVYDNKSYVTNNVTVKKGMTLPYSDPTTTYIPTKEATKTEEYKGTEATKAEEVVLYFPDTNEFVVVSNRKSDTPLVAVKGKVNGDTKIGVWYKNSTLSSSDGIVRGVAMGIDFSKYNNEG